ncbi:MAG: hypothetical protein DRN49_00955 [Thaumarchaeota archaeon]|nr:MAG: hypothetical protein DRN49_00955 [Nitrososphaerota archaeon]
MSFLPHLGHTKLLNSNVAIDATYPQVKCSIHTASLTSVDPQISHLDIELTGEIEVLVIGFPLMLGSKSSDD